MCKMYPDGGRKLARKGMRNKLLNLHGLIMVDKIANKRPDPTEEHAWGLNDWN